MCQRNFQFPSKEEVGEGYKCGWQVGECELVPQVEDLFYDFYPALVDSPLARSSAIRKLRSLEHGDRIWVPAPPLHHGDIIVTLGIIFLSNVSLHQGGNSRIVANNSLMKSSTTVQSLLLGVPDRLAGQE